VLRKESHCVGQRLTLAAAGKYAASDSSEECGGFLFSRHLSEIVSLVLSLLDVLEKSQCILVRYLPPLRFKHLFFQLLNV
jgi:hypothetical protein